MGNSDKETQQVIMSIQKATLLMDPFFKLTMVGTAMLITYLARMAKEGKIAKGEFKSAQEFFKLTEGRYHVVNLPYDKQYSPWAVESRTVDGRDKFVVVHRDSGEVLEDKKGNILSWSTAGRAEKEAKRMNTKESLVLEELQKSDIRHTILPDLNKEDGMVQIAVYDDDKELFAAWMERYVINRMQGGEKSFRDLSNLTEGRTKIVSLPIEGNDAIASMKDDFQKMKINYAILPDLHVGDGEMQIIVPDRDVESVGFWMKLHNEDSLQRGKDVKEMKMMDMDAYRNTGNMTEEQYVDTASKDLKQANEKYEGREPGQVEKILQKETIKSESDSRYADFETNPDYQKISIDHDACVKNSHLVTEYKQKADECGLFYSRIPGTWNGGQRAPELTLLLPKDHVFVANEGKTYYAFIEKEKKPLVLGGDGKLMPENQRLKGKEIYRKYYEPVLHEAKAKQPLGKQQTEHLVKAQKVIAPMPPIK